MQRYHVCAVAAWCCLFSHTVEATVLYHLAEASRKVCPVGFAGPADKDACGRAAVALGRAFDPDRSPTSTHPKGCYVFTGGGADAQKVFFNAHETGDSNIAGRLVCQTAFFLDAAGVSSCSVGLTGATLQECQHLAEAWGGLELEQVQGGAYPRGCSKVPATENAAAQVVFNSGSTNAGSDAQLVCKTMFYATGRGTTACSRDDGLLSIADIATCEAAAASLRKPWVGIVSSANDPEGCFHQFLESGVQGKVAYNTHGMGSMHIAGGVVCQARYKFMPDGCDGATQPLSTVGSCSAAAAALELPFGSVLQNPSNPSGCIRMSLTGYMRLFFNDVDDGRANMMATPVCLHPPPVTTTTMTSTTTTSTVTSTSTLATATAREGLLSTAGAHGGAVLAYVVAFLVGAPSLSV